MERRQFGRWQFDPRTLTLECPTCPGEYWFSVAPMDTAEGVLDVLLQVRHKTWADSGVVHDLLNALDALLAPQETMCSGAMGRNGDARKVRELIRRSHAIDERAEAFIKAQDARWSETEGTFGNPCDDCPEAGAEVLSWQI